MIDLPTWILPEQERLASPNIYRDRIDPGGMRHEPDVLVIHYAVDGDQSDDGDEEEEFDRNFLPRKPSDDCWDVMRGFQRTHKVVNGKKKRSGNSAHFVIGRDGSKGQAVALDNGAWTVGDGALPREGIGPLGAALPRRRGELNCRSINIELSNAGWAVDQLKIEARHIEAGLRHRNPACHSTRWESYRPVQLSTLDYVTSQLMIALPSLRFVLGHEDVTHKGVTGKGAKCDPGPAFPWDAIPWAVYGLQRLVFDFRLQAWVFAGDEVTKPIDVGGLRK